MGNGFFGEHSGKGVLRWHENRSFPFSPSTLITTNASVQQEEIKVNFRGILLPPHVWAEPALALVQLAWVGCSHVQDICKLGVSRSPVFNYGI